MLPHLRRALQLRHRLAAATDGAGPAAPGLAALDALATGVLVLDADMHVLVANAAAEAMAQRAEGAALRLLRATAGPRCGAARTVAAAGCRQDGAALHRLVRATALGGGAGGALRLRDAGGLPALAALVAPLPRRLAGAAPGAAPASVIARVEGRALLLLRDLRPAGQAAAPRIELLRGLFGLTRAEAEVARALTGGATKAAVAEARGLRETTVRTQVRAVLDKTGAANLRELERLLAGLDGM